MKAIIFLILNAIMITSYCQQTKNDSLIKLHSTKKYLESSIQVLTDSLKKVDLRIEEVEKNLAFERLTKLDSQYYIETTVNFSARLYEESNNFSKELTRLIKGEKIRLYDFENGYWLISNNTVTGYFSDAFIISTDAIKRFKEILIERNEKNELLRIAQEALEKAHKDSIEYSLVKKSGKYLTIYHALVSSPNSADGVSFSISWRYLNREKTIKYLYFTVIPYNAVGDIQSCRIGDHSTFTGKITGPVKADNESQMSWWENAWYNNTISCIKITKVRVEYTDGTSYTYINEIPKLLVGGFTNNCK